MTDVEETGDPEPIEFLTLWILGGLFALACLLGCICWGLGQCVGDTDRSRTEIDPCCGLQKCFKSCFSSLWRTLCCCCNRGATGAADAVAVATDDLIDDKPRRPGGAYDECCGCGDCWGTLTCGLFGGGGKGGVKRRRRGRGMPPPVPIAQPIDKPDDKPAALAEPSNGEEGGLFGAMRAAAEKSEESEARYSNSPCVPLLAVRVSGAKRA